MGDLLARAGRIVLHAAAMAWLLVLAPIELATALAGLTSGPPQVIGLGGSVLIALRVLVTATGLVLGRRLAGRLGWDPTPERAAAHDLRALAIAWALADLVTLAIVLASASLPSNRQPGDGPIVWFGYALAAGVVLAAAVLSGPTHAPRRTKGD